MREKRGRTDGARIVGRRCALLEDVETEGGTRYRAGTSWRIYGTWRGVYHLEQTDDAGARVAELRMVSRFRFRLLEEQGEAIS